MTPYGPNRGPKLSKDQMNAVTRTLPESMPCPVDGSPSMRLGFNWRLAENHQHQLNTYWRHDDCCEFEVMLTVRISGIHVREKKTR
jgi:hypothetical protein